MREKCLGFLGCILKKGKFGIGLNVCGKAQFIISLLFLPPIPLHGPM